MADIVLDTSAVLAVINRERGWEGVVAVMASSVISTVNLAEAMTRLVADGGEPEDAARTLRNFGMEVAPFNAVDAEMTGAMVAQTKKHGLSLGDRACLSLAVARGLPAWTGDRSWSDLDVGCEVRLFR